MLTDHEAARLVEKLGLERKVRLLTGADTWRTGAETALGLRAMTLSDGPAGVRGTAWDERLTSLLLPSPTALAALWDEALVGEVGAVLAAEARRKGVDVVLAPTLNLHRSPLGGRHFECFSEDPWLAGRVGAALVRGVQGGGVAATAKHFVANDAETERLTVDVRVGERTLREVYLAPFEAAVEAGVWVVMSAYNRVGGVAMAANGLLREPLKAEWGFDGVVVSDWGAVREPLEGAAGALDLVMPGPDGPWGEALVAAVREGRVSESAVDEKVTRLLRLASRVGALEDSAPLAPPPPPPGARAVARRVAASSAVLLRNDGTLPLRPGRLRTVAVVGPHAVRPRVQGGGSAEVFPERVVSPLEGLRAALPGVRVVAVPGPAVLEEPVPLDPPLARRPGTDEPGVRVRMLDAAGGELYEEHRLSGRILEPRLVAGAHTVEVAARLVPEEAGVWTFGVAGWGRMSLTVDGRAVVEGVFARTRTTRRRCTSSRRCGRGGCGWRRGARWRWWPAGSWAGTTGGRSCCARHRRRGTPPRRWQRRRGPRRRPTWRWWWPGRRRRASRRAGTAARWRCRAVRTHWCARCSAPSRTRWSASTRAARWNCPGTERLRRSC